VAGASRAALAATGLLAALLGALITAAVLAAAYRWVLKPRLLQIYSAKDE
jgi:hypothetical protein